MGLVRMQFVVAVSENDVIGRRNQLPWHLAADLRRFKTLTLGKPILMGRRTYDSIGHALPGRLNLVLSRAPGFAPAGCTVVPSLDAACAAAGDAPLMVIGGAEVYRQCVPATECIHLTLVHTHIEDGDAFFTAWRSPEWHEVARERHAADERNSSAYSFITLVRAGSSGSADSISRSARA